VTYECNSEVVAKELLDALSSVEEGKKQKRIKSNPIRVWLCRPH